nr:PQQ-dependent sugar dehydrogenase [Pseudomonadota bacterium]
MTAAARPGPRLERGLRRGVPWMLAGGLAMAPAAPAQVVADGSAGPAGPLPGPDYAVTADLGR